MKKIIAGILSLALCFALFGCGDSTPTNPPETTAPPISDLYTQAAQPLRDAENLKIQLNIKKTVSTDITSFQTDTTQELILTGLGTDSLIASMEEEIKMGVYYSKFTEFFQNDELYVYVYDAGYFKGEMTDEDFLARFAPAALLDETLYGDITSETTDSGTTMTFTNPMGAETWALPEGASFVDGDGTAEITAAGDLSKTTYTLQYIQGKTTVSMEVSAEAKIYTLDAPKPPKNDERYVQVDSIEVPRLYDTACFYATTLDTVSSVLNQTLVCQASNYTQVDQITLHYSGTGANHISSIQQVTSSVNSYGATNTSTVTEQFRDGQFTYSLNNGPFTPDATITAGTMFQYAQGYITDNTHATEYIVSTSMESVNGLIYLKIGLNEQWGKKANQAICYSLYEDENYLDNLATDYQTASSTYYMFLDPATGFPLSSGTTYVGSHTINGQEYLLCKDITQSYQLANSATYVQLTDQLPAETEPAQKAAPLLYHVTGSDGQEMYLMGTIHVGDTKTNYLPEEVYAAFNASNALAVEADVIAFQEEVATNQTLAAQFVAAQTNPNGKTLMEQLDSDLHEKAVMLLKASGKYSGTIEYMHPYTWNSIIENLYISFTGLQSEKGMDMRLLRLAKEQNKEIREIESAIFQYETMASLPIKLQSMLLEETVNATAAEYCEQVQTLYDLWCAGDEDALREILKTDTSELTNEERALYQKYIDSMIINRNDAMLQVAISYLESEDTVFYAVGLAHLLQENGLVDALRDAGYTVEQIIYK